MRIELTFHRKDIIVDRGVSLTPKDIERYKWKTAVDYAVHFHYCVTGGSYTQSAKYVQGFIGGAKDQTRTMHLGFKIFDTNHRLFEQQKAMLTKPYSKDIEALELKFIEVSPKEMLKLYAGDPQILVKWRLGQLSLTN